MKDTCKKPVEFYASPTDFSVQLMQSVNEARLVTTFPEHLSHTTALPHTYDYFQEHLPSVLKTKCFNPENLPFDQEIVNTEMGHLFEHVILDLLVQAKIQQGAEHAVFNGSTKWDWHIASKGNYEITLSVSIEESPLLQEALPQAMAWIQNLIDFGKDSQIIQKGQATAIACPTHLKRSIF